MIFENFGHIVQRTSIVTFLYMGNILGISWEEKKNSTSPSSHKRKKKNLGLGFMPHLIGYKVIFFLLVFFAIFGLG
jgi:hypothetical protein